MTRRFVGSSVVDDDPGPRSGVIRALKTVLRETPVHDLVRLYRNRRDLAAWQRQGRPDPPPHCIKQGAILEYAERFRLTTLIETGTYLGAMVSAVRRRFDRIISIELDRTLWESARRRFARYPHITIVHGDSMVELPGLLAGIREPCLFWLDAHFSGANTARGSLDTPIVEEVRRVLQHPVRGHVVLIDDARLFVGRDGYPTTAELTAVVALLRPGWACEVKDDIIRLHDRAELGVQRPAVAQAEGGGDATPRRAGLSPGPELIESSGVRDGGRVVSRAALGEFKDSEYACRMFWFRRARG